jgi:NADH-quinone oxidoreductase subunit N
MDNLHSAALTGVFRNLLPEIVLGAGACLLFLGGTFKSSRHLWGWTALGGLLVSLLACGVAPTYEPSPQATFGNPVLFDSLTSLIRIIAIGGGIVLILFGWNEVPHSQAADHHACLLVIIAGVCLTAAANDLVMLFLALELISIPTYILLYLPRHDEAAQEAALKYFLLSIFSSALVLFGFSYLYGLAGTTNIAALLHTLNSQPSPRDIPAIAQVALIMVVAGLGFRITAAPFHFYAPDVYQGAPTVGAALLAFIPKLAGFVALLRVLGFVLPAGVPARGGLIGMGLSEQVPILFWFLAVITMFLGNILALLQDNVKRLLAYSSVAHAGYMLIAVASAPYLAGAGTGMDGVAALLFYLVAYGVTTIGAFAVVSYLSTLEHPLENVDDLAGLSRNHPVVALVMAVFLFSLIGIPLTAGFTGKFFVFFGALAVPGEPAYLFTVLAFLGVINAAIGGWYYLRVVAVMYLRGSVKPIEVPSNRPALITLALCVLFTVALSIPPGVNWLTEATRSVAGATHAPAGAVVAMERK